MRLWVQCKRGDNPAPLLTAAALSGVVREVRLDGADFPADLRHSFKDAVETDFTLAGDSFCDQGAFATWAGGKTPPVYLAGPTLTYRHRCGYRPTPGDLRDSELISQGDDVAPLFRFADNDHNFEGTPLTLPQPKEMRPWFSLMVSHNQLVAVGVSENGQISTRAVDLPATVKTATLGEAWEKPSFTKAISYEICEFALRAWWLAILGRWQEVGKTLDMAWNKERNFLTRAGVTLSSADIAYAKLRGEGFWGGRPDGCLLGPV